MEYDETSAASFLLTHNRIWLRFWPMPMGPFSRVVLTIYKLVCTCETFNSRIISINALIVMCPGKIAS